MIRLRAIIELLTNSLNVALISESLEKETFISRRVARCPNFSNSQCDDYSLPCLGMAKSMYVAIFMLIKLEQCSNFSFYS